MPLPPRIPEQVDKVFDEEQPHIQRPLHTDELWVYPGGDQYGYNVYIEIMGRNGYSAVYGHHVELNEWHCTAS